MIKIPAAGEFYETMKNAYRERAGFEAEAASDIGVRLGVLSCELERLALEIARLRGDAFPQSSAGQALELHAGARGLARRSARTARGILMFSRATPASGSITVPAGLLCSSENGELRFETIQEGTIPAGEKTVRISAAAVTAGESGNVPPGVINTLLGAAPGISAVTNPDSFYGGGGEESDDELRARLMQSLTDSPNAFNAAFYREAASNFPGVRTAKVLPKNRGVGTVDVIIAALDGCDEAQTVSGLQQTLESRREIATDVKVSAAVRKYEDIAAVIQVAEGFGPDETAAACRAALRTYAQSLEIGQPLLPARLGWCIMSVEGVENFRLISPAADKKPGSGELIAAGAVDVERMTLV